FDSLPAVVVVQESSQVGGKDAAADPLVGESDNDLQAAQRQGRRDLGADEAAADDREAAALPHHLAQAMVVVQGPKVDDALVAEVETARRGPRREQQLVEGVDGPRIVGDALVARVQLQGLPPAVKHYTRLLGLAPDAFQRLVLP